MCAFRHGDFEMLEIWLESLWKGQYTYVQSKSVINTTLNYNKNITVNDVGKSLCVVHALSASTTELHLHDS